MIARRYPMLAQGIDHPALLLARFPVKEKLIQIDTPQWVRDTVNDFEGADIANQKTLSMLQALAAENGVYGSEVQYPERLVDRRLHQRDDLARHFRLERELADRRLADYDPEIFWRANIGRPRDRDEVRRRLRWQADQLPHLDLPWTLSRVASELRALRDDLDEHRALPRPYQGWTFPRIKGLIEMLQLLHWHLAAHQVADDQAAIEEASTRCLFCGRPLRSHSSRIKRSGPECLRAWSATAGLGYNEPRSMEVYQHIMALERQIDWDQYDKSERRERWAGSDDLEHAPIAHLILYANWLYNANQGQLKNG